MNAQAQPITQLTYEGAIYDVTQAPPADSKLVANMKAEVLGVRLDKLVHLAILWWRGAKGQIDEVACDREVHELVEPHAAENLGLHVGHEFRVCGGAGVTS